MMNNNKSFEQLKKEMLSAMTDLLDYMYINNKNFDTEGYPNYLPSFDEFIADMYEIEEVDE